MASNAGRVAPLDDSLASSYGRCMVVFPHGDEEHLVSPLPSPAVARVICDILAVKAAVDAGQHDLSSVPLLSRQHSLASAPQEARQLILSASFAQLARQLQDCAVPSVRCWESLRSPCSVARTAACLGHTCSLQILLLLHPEAASTTNVGNQTALHAAAHWGHAPAVQLLLDSTQLAVALQADSRGCTPLHLAAWHGNLAAVQLLVAAAPAAATMQDAAGRTPLHLAALLTRPDVAQHLLAAVPAAGAMRDGSGQTPLQAVLSAGKGHAALADFVIAAVASSEYPWPTNDEWMAVQAPCPDLAQALPAALASSEALAGQVVRLLPDEDRQRLRTLALCLARTQHQQGISLPVPILGMVLAQSVYR
ncbi:hypothetical protein D9Q98_008192 [Chlorella vulgaris]|uniref:Uncharacterized protein n=1 Tax=Chlorella vulgaris TaxID=3077 RepID=A0A9D4YSU8_CHLVU|nr:hypothetical protein D9Q98_008192 [Chlorella vulgaris]